MQQWTKFKLLTQAFQQTSCVLHKKQGHKNNDFFEAFSQTLGVHLLYKIKHHTHHFCNPKINQARDSQPTLNQESKTNKSRTNPPQTLSSIRIHSKTPKFHLTLNTHSTFHNIQKPPNLKFKRESENNPQWEVKEIRESQRHTLVVQKWGVKNENYEGDKKSLSRVWGS